MSRSSREIRYAVVMIVVALAAGSFAVAGSTATVAEALVGGTLVDGTGAAPVNDAVVVIASGKIACAGSRAACPVPKGAEVLDVKGSWVTPGLVDAHVHLSQSGWADSHPDSLDVRDRYPYEQVQAELRAHPERLYRPFLCSGVTAVFDMGGYTWVWDERARTFANPDAPRVAAVGPLLSTLDHWLNLPAERQFIAMGDEKKVRESVRYLAYNRTDAVELWLPAPRERRSDEFANKVRAAADETHKLGLPLVADTINLIEAKQALEVGANLLAHSVTDQLMDAEFIALAKKNGTIYCPTLTMLKGYLRLFEAVASGKPPTIDDPNGCVDATMRARVAETASLGPGRVDSKHSGAVQDMIGKAQAVAYANLQTVVAAGIPVAMGTDAGNSLTLHGPAVYAEMEAMQAAGMTPIQVLVASTRTGALAMGAAGKDIGTIEAGKAADVLVVGADPTADIAAMRKLKLVIRAGTVHHVSDLAATR